MRPDGRPEIGGAAGTGTARRAVFTPVDTRARVDTVVRRIGDAIELGLLADGEQLPGETELAGQLGVSTVTLREALMALRQQGLVTTRRGRGGGSFVTLPDSPPEERLRARLADWSTEELRDLGDHWAAVSGAAALLAARRTQPGDLRPLVRTAEEFATAEDPATRSRLLRTLPRRTRRRGPVRPPHPRGDRPPDRPGRTAVPRPRRARLSAQCVGSSPRCDLRSAG